MAKAKTVVLFDARDSTTTEYFPGCCGISVIYDLSAAEYAAPITAAEERRLTKITGGTDDDAADKAQETLDEARETEDTQESNDEMFEETSLVLASTIPSQKTEIAVLAANGFKKLTSFRNQGGNVVTLWGRINK